MPLLFVCRSCGSPACDSSCEASHIGWGQGEKAVEKLAFRTPKAKHERDRLTAASNTLRDASKAVQRALDGQDRVANGQTREARRVSMRRYMRVRRQREKAKKQADAGNDTSQLGSPKSVVKH